MILALLAACADGTDADTAGTGGDTLAAPVCDPATLTLTVDLRAADLPSDYELPHTEPGVALADIDGDGDLDALAAWGGGAFGARNDGTGRLAIDPTIDFDGGATSIRGGSVAFADLDQDGDPDAYLGEYGGGDLLLWNDGTGHFTTQRLSTGDPTLSPWTGAWGDADGDGDLDLYISIRTPDIIPQDVLDGNLIGGANYLYVNEGDGVFTRDDSRVPQEDNYGLTFHATWVDLDGDDDLDIYEANDWGQYITPNRILWNDGTGHFTEQPDAAMYGMGVAIGDVQGDGLPDLVVTDLNTPRLFENLGGALADSTLARGMYVPPSETNFTSWGTSFLDFDRNGCSDVAVAYGRLGSSIDGYLDELAGVEDGAVDPELQADVLMLNGCDGTFSRATGTDFDVYLDRDRALAVGDLDGDGRDDIVSTGRDFFRVWMAGGGCENGVTVSLSQPGKNPAGIGARVTMHAGGRDQVMWMLRSATHSESALALTFGLGNATEGTVDVHWPDGSDTTGVAVTAGDVVTIEP